MPNDILPTQVQGAEGPLLSPGANVWKVAHADRFSLIVDAEDYFTAAREAMLKAERSIFLVGWDFDPRIKLCSGPPQGPEGLGDFIFWLADRNPDLKIRLLRWDIGALRSMFNIHTLLTVLRWKMHPRITMRFDNAHPLGSSHHQKIVVIDDRVAFCGGIDMTADRWDRRAHLDDEPGRVRPDGTPYGPWHDATTAFDGEAARAMGELARERWKRAGGETIEPIDGGADCWPDMLKPSLTNVRVGIARTRPEMPDVEPVNEIERLYIDLIRRARHTVYAESQYFASRRVARAIAERLNEPDGPEFVIINPENTDGWLEPLAMDSARARLVQALQRIDRHGKFRVYHPVTAGGERIYVHAKILIVDDCCLRIGSSNINNRSLGFDTECDVALASDEPGNGHVPEFAKAARSDLVAEHLGVTVEELAPLPEDNGSLIKVIERLRGERGSGRTLVPYQIPDLPEGVKWLADNEILDPEAPDRIFESLEKRGLFKNWHFPRFRRTRR